MFLGPGGSGKSSLLDGLMNQPLSPAESTALADVKDIWVEAADAAEDAWRLIEEEDQFQELKSLCDQASKDKVERPQDAAAGVKAPDHTASASFNHNVQMAAEVQKDVTESVVQNTRQVKQKQQELQLMKQEQQKQKQLQQEEQRQEEQQQQHWLQPTEHQWLQQLKQQLQEKLQQRLSKNTPPSTRSEVMMRIWDCGGQPVFLDILSAFLSSPTIFLLVFDASKALNINCQECWNHEGHSHYVKEYNITFLQLMMQWMRLIHASHVAKSEIGTYAEKTTESDATHVETAHSEATTDRKQPISLPLCPKIMIVGTHGDKVSDEEKKQVGVDIESTCHERALQCLIIDKMIVDNTKAGKGKSEDPSYRKIRKAAYEFTCSHTQQTPVAWVFFRQLVQKAATKYKLLSFDQVTDIAQMCGIDASKVPSVLHFYHQLGIFLYYREIKSLSNTIIVEPQWLIKTLCELLMPEVYELRPENLTDLWQHLEKNGVLVEPLYQGLWKNCGLTGGAQALVDLLEHFDLAKKIDNSSVPKEIRRHNGYMYFVPCMLKDRLQEGPHGEAEKTTGKPQKVIQEAATLHITFNTKYIPPGFFIRLAVQMTKSKMCTLAFDESGMYRDSINFRYGQVDRVTIAESKSLDSVCVDVIRDVKRTYSISRFADSCVSFRGELCAMCTEVLHWFPSIELDFAFKCSCSMDAGEHFANIKNAIDRDSKFFCDQDREYQVNPEHKYWLPLAQHTLQVSISSAFVISLLYLLFLLDSQV